VLLDIASISLKTVEASLSLRRGLLLRCSCDVRIMTESGHMGLNEVALGIPVPDFWAQNMVRVIGEPCHSHVCNVWQPAATLAGAQS
jgi:hypothetical protein